MNVFDLVAVLTLNKSDYEKGLNDAKDEASGIGSKIGSGLKTVAKVGSVAFTAATAATVAFGKSAVSAGQDFDKSMSQVAATMGMTTAQLNATEEELANMTEEERNNILSAQQNFATLRDFAQQMGATTAFSATEAAEALNYMALAGYDAETSMKMLPNVLNLAAAGGIDLAYASDMVTDAQSALGLSLEETEHLVDMIAKTSSTTNTSVSQLGEALLTVGGTAKNLAFGSQEAAQVLGLLADNGIKGSEGGTALRNVILSLSAPTDKAAAAMERLNMKVFDEQGNMRALESIFLELGDSLSELTQEEQTVALNEIFNKVDLKSVNALLGTNEERWRDVWEATDHARGAAQAMADTQLDNLSGDITLFKSALEGAKIAVSDGITPALREFVSFGTDGLSRLTLALKEGGVSGAMEELGNILGEGLSMLLKKIPDILGAGGKLLTTILDTLIDALPEVLDKIATFIADNAGTFVNALLKMVTKIVNSFSTVIRPLIKAMPKIIREVAQAIIDNLPEIVKGVTDLIVMLAEELPEIIMAIIDVLPDLIISIMEAIVDNLPTIITALINMVLMLVDHLPEIINGIIEALPTIITLICQALIDNLPLLIQGAISLVVGIVQNLPKIIAGLIEALPDIIKAIVDGFSGLGDALGGVFGAALDICGGILGELGEVAMGVFNWIGTLMDDPAKALEDAFDGIKNYASKVFESVKTIITGVFDLIDAKQQEAKAKEMRARTEEAVWKEIEAGKLKMEENENGTHDFTDEYVEYLTAKGLLGDGTATISSDYTWEQWKSEPKHQEKVDVSGEITIKGVNNEGEFVGAAQMTEEELARMFQTQGRLY